jgi:hypothetical protein
LRNKQTVKNLDTSTNAKNLHGQKFLGQEEDMYREKKMYGNPIPPPPPPPPPPPLLLLLLPPIQLL